MISSAAILDLLRNKISGTVPSEIGQLSGLSELILATNDFEGQIPLEVYTSLTNLGKLRVARVQPRVESARLISGCSYLMHRDHHRFSDVHHWNDSNRGWIADKPL